MGCYGGIMPRLDGAITLAFNHAGWTDGWTLQEAEENLTVWDLLVYEAGPLGQGIRFTVGVTDSRHLFDQLPEVVA